MGLTVNPPFTYFQAVSNAFRDFEHSGWESVVAEYDAAFGRLTTQAIEPLLDAAEARPGARLLDVASGPGYVAGAAAKRGASAVGVDLDRKSTRLNSSHIQKSRMPSSA